MATAIILFACNVNAQSNATINKVLNTYIQLKDALVKSDGVLATNCAKNLLTTIKEVNTKELDKNIHSQWTKVLGDLTEGAQHISESKEISRQRDYFTNLSQNLYSVIKASKSETPVYYQFCPMANKGKGANWLSLESKIKNPYYGNQMLSCGRVVETIQ